VPRPPDLSPDAPDRSYDRSVSVLLRMSPEFLERIDAAARAANRKRLPYLLEQLDLVLPRELDLDEDAQEARLAS
jgi:hypothetical protein